jgi:D-glycero-alpha-D-manno-heptose 1-phosphate guanylyltransferase
LEAIVLAGGLGTRLRAAVPGLPKPMAPVNGRPFLERLLDYWIGQGVKRIILSTGYRHGAIQGHFGKAHRRVPIRYAVEERPRGTGGGLLLAAEALSRRETFLVLNGDTWFEVPLKTLARFHASRRPDVTLALFRSLQEGRYTGLRVGKDGEVLSFSAGEKGGLANGGVYLMEWSLLASAPQVASAPLSLEEDILPLALRGKKRVYGLECGGRFLDIGVPEDYARAGAVLGAAQEMGNRK